MLNLSLEMFLFHFLMQVKEVKKKNNGQVEDLMKVLIHVITCMYHPACIEFTLCRFHTPVTLHNGNTSAAVKA